MDNTKSELVIPPGGYAHMQDLTKGAIKTMTGPTVVTPTAQDRPILFDGTRYNNVNTLDDALRLAPIAPEGHYIVLRNPAEKNAHPNEGGNQASPPLEIGRAIIVPGPATFALWPGQTAEVIEGHHLRSNQYLLVRVYNEEEARQNWSHAVVKLVTPTSPTTTDTDAQPNVATEPPPDLTVGRELIIRGTEVSFYIPPTGIEVVSTVRENGDGDPYVRDALTLERLEYCILVDENGNKRYEKGPQVVFPLPTEQFILSKDESGRTAKKLRAIELNEIQGIHIKVIAPYKEGERSFKEGDELFITGHDTKIYYPREEHSAVKYDGRAKHFATAIPAGEARYVMDRITGVIRTAKGPQMLLPDPRKEVVVRRVLTDTQSEMWYPTNKESLEYNRSLRTIMQNTPTTRQGVVSEGDVQRGSTTKAATQASLTGSALLRSSTANYMAMDASNVSRDQVIAGDEFSRASTYTSPRTITLETKFQGVPTIDIWTGYAVQVVSRTGKRRVVKGPQTVLLDYDEVLEVLELSTGKPKTTDKLLRVPYLRADNNKVSDIFEIETSDHVQVQFKLSYLVNFDGGASERWFAVDNYVKFLCDHVRSILKGRARKMAVEALYADSTDFIRNTILGETQEGKARPGMQFEQNGMRITDVEVLSVELLDERIKPLLKEAQHNTVRTNIELSTATRNLEVFTKKQDIARRTADEENTTSAKVAELAALRLTRELTQKLAEVQNEAALAQQRLSNQLNDQVKAGEISAAKMVVVKSEAAVEEEIARAEIETRLKQLHGETLEYVARIGAVDEKMALAITVLADNQMVERISKDLAPMAQMSGMSVADVLKNLFKDTSVGSSMEMLATRTSQRRQLTTTGAAKS